MLAGDVDWWCWLVLLAGDAGLCLVMLAGGAGW